MKEVMEQIIYVSLENEGTVSFRPMIAELLEDGTYLIKSAPDDADITDEDLQFEPGEIVVCEKQEVSGEEALVAVRGV